MGAEKASKRYRGEGAIKYEERRAGKRKWTLENEGVEKLLTGNIKTVLDVPVGTGRFYYLYLKRGIDATGVDTSQDMLKEAKRKGMKDLHVGDIRKLKYPDKSFDAAICIRLLAWFEPEEARYALKELARVAKILIVNIRTNYEKATCKNGSLWNHSHSDFLDWIKEIGYVIDEPFNVGDNGNNIYRVINAN